jgi:hypothetical protein
VRVESDLTILTAWFPSNLEGECRESLFGETDDTFPPILVGTLQENDSRLGPVDKSIHRDDSDWGVKNELSVIRLVHN